VTAVFGVRSSNDPQRRPKNERIKRTITTAPTSQMMLFMEFPVSLDGSATDMFRLNDLSAGWFQACRAGIEQA